MTYDPFARGGLEVEETTLQGLDKRRSEHFTYEIWAPKNFSGSPLLLFSPFSGGSRTASRFLCEHLARHGYTVAALDHSDRRMPKPSEAATDEQRTTRMQALIGSRVPDLRWLLDTVRPHDRTVGVAGHSFGGWTALAAPSQESRIRSVVAMAPAGSRHPRPGIIPARLDFALKRRTPVLILAGERDVSIPIDDAFDVFQQTPEPKRLVALRGVDHLHFVDDAQAAHERVREMQFPAELAWMQQEMRPWGELRPQAETHALIAALALAHFDATLKERGEAREFLDACPPLV